MTTPIKPVQRTAVVVSNQKVSDKVYVAQFECKAPLPMEFLPGQYNSFVISPTIRRTFSLATPPSRTPIFEICADITPMGPGSVWLMGLKPGDSVSFLGPLGKFVLDEESSRRRVFVATGTGISPIRSMIYHSLEIQQNKDISLYWGLRYEADMFWHREFLDLAAKNPAFHYYMTLSRAGDGWSGLRGRVTDYLLTKEQDIRTSDVYICGSRDMIADVKKQALDKRIPEIQIKTELFF